MNQVIQMLGAAVLLLLGGVVRDPFVEADEITHG